MRTAQWPKKTIGLRPQPGLPENVDGSLRLHRYRKLIAPMIAEFRREQKARTQYLNR